MSEWHTWQSKPMNTAYGCNNILFDFETCLSFLRNARAKKCFSNIVGNNENDEQFEHLYFYFTIFSTILKKLFS
jgi:hypothetical protein